MPSPKRCPYCIDGKKFKAMKERLEGAWLECELCGHVEMPQDDEFHCCCKNCSKRKSPGGRQRIQ